MTPLSTDEREQVLDGLEAAIRDPECPVQFSPLLMAARRLIVRAPSPSETVNGEILEAAAAEAIRAAALDPETVCCFQEVVCPSPPCACAQQLAHAALSRASSAPAGAGWQDISTAPKDGTLLQLLVSHETPGEESANPTENEIVFRTIGHNNFWHDDEDVWKFAGWNWENDYWTEGRGKPTHWMPLPAPPATIADERTDG